MSAARAGDRIISEANAIVLAAARKIDDAVKDVYRAARLLEGHPQFVRSGRQDPLPSVNKINLPTWRCASLVSVLDDVNLADAARLLRLEVREDEKTMTAYIREEGQEKAARLAKAA